MLSVKTTSFKTCLFHDGLMRITDPRWPAVREVARMILRVEDLLVKGPGWLEEPIVELGLRLADVQPARTMFPSFVLEEGDGIQLMETCSAAPLASCSLDEPDVTTVWIPMPPSLAWEAISKICDDLLRAGYPGCLGCGGPHTEGEWDEVSSRQNMSTGE